MILYSYFRSSTAYRARIALNFKGVPYTQIPVHLLENGGQQHKPHYRAINPTGEVPSLVHEGKILSQSFAIIEYLEDLFPKPSLFPVSAFDRAKVRQICENINCGIHPLSNLKTTQYLSKNLSANQDQIDKWQLHWISDGLTALEKIVSQTAGNYAYGDAITAADLFIVPQLFSARRFNVETSLYPTLSRVEKLALTLEAFQNAHPLRQPDSPKDENLKP